MRKWLFAIAVTLTFAAWFAGRHHGRLQHPLAAPGADADAARPLRRGRDDGRGIDLPRWSGGEVERFGLDVRSG